MITRISGTLTRLGEEVAGIEAGPFEYEVYIPDFVRRQLQDCIGKVISLKTIEYLEGNPQRGGKMTPRLVGFLHDAEREFFEMICSVDGVGVKKALQAMVRPVRDVATAIEEQDIKALSALPGIGPSLAERIVAKLRRKMAKFALLIGRDLPEADPKSRDVMSEGYQALVALGHSPGDARTMIERVVQRGTKIKSVQELLNEVYRQQHQIG